MTALLEQIAFFLSAIGCGNVLSIGVHVFAWKMRRHATVFWCGVGGFSFAVMTGAVLLGFYLAGWDLKGESLNTGVRTRDWVSLGIFGLALNAIIGTIGFIHSRYQKIGCGTASILQWAETGVAFLLYFGAIRVLYANDTYFLNRNLEIDSWATWFSGSFAISLLSLAALHLLCIRWASDILQTWRDWFSLNYQWKKSKS